MLREAKKKDMKNPFRRLSVDLFVKLIQLSEAPTILTCGRVCSEWSKVLFEQKITIFSVFRMKSNELPLKKSLELFNLRSGNSIKEIDIELTQGFGRNHNFKRLKSIMLLSKSTLTSLCIKHYGGVAALVFSVAGECKNLKSLQFIELGNHSSAPRSAATEVSLSERWPSMEVLVWTGISSKLVANQALLDSLKQAKSVTLSG